MNNTQSEPLDCGHHPTSTPFPDYADGAVWIRGLSVCYDCASAKKREDLLTRRRITAYVSRDGRTLTTWNGDTLGRVVVGHQSPWSPERHYIAAVDVHGGHWQGTGTTGGWADLKRCHRDGHTL